MSIMIDGVVFRNLEEQVQKNKEDIAAHYAIDRALANFGIKIVGTVSTPEQLPDPLTYSGEYGDGYAVGQPGAYVYYIFTRPDLNAGYPNNYWLNVGSISIVGPVGPQGPQGVPGPEGKSTKFYASANYPLEANEGDLYLSSTGMVYEYVNNDWIARVNLRGPQGIQGIQGPIGPQGIEGPVGPQGPRGDIGGFISVAGILSSEGELPTPSQLGNLTLAYLVGTVEPYDLYIQIGETSAEATWNNVGPLNVATMVTVNGQFQNTWDADTKVDKITSTGVSRVYTITGAGNQGTVNYGPTPVPSWIPIYEPGQGGALQVGTPLKEIHAVNKLYLDTELAKKVDKVTPTANATYAYSVVKNNTEVRETITEIAASAKVNTVPLRGASGNFYVGTPTVGGHSANKDYVDNMWDKIYPVGSIYMNVNQVDPSLLFGGTWEQIKDKFLLASGDTYANGSEGGSADAVVVEHTHKMNIARNATVGSFNGYPPMIAQGDYTIVETPSVIVSTGESGTEKNMPPYIAVNVWKRTA